QKACNGQKAGRKMPLPCAPQQSSEAEQQGISTFVHFYLTRCDNGTLSRPTLAGTPYPPGPSLETYCDSESSSWLKSSIRHCNRLRIESIPKSLPLLSTTGRWRKCRSTIEARASPGVVAEVASSTGVVITSRTSVFS